MTVLPPTVHFLPPPVEGLPPTAETMPPTAQTLPPTRMGVPRLSRERSQQAEYQYTLLQAMFPSVDGSVVMLVLSESGDALAAIRALLEISQGEPDEATVALFLSLAGELERDLNLVPAEERIVPGLQLAFAGSKQKTPFALRVPEASSQAVSAGFSGIVGGLRALPRIQMPRVRLPFAYTCPCGTRGVQQDARQPLQAVRLPPSAADLGELERASELSEAGSPASLRRLLEEPSHALSLIHI